jgi:hypothetical protein
MHIEHKTSLGGIGGLKMVHRLSLAESCPRSDRVDFDLVAVTHEVAVRYRDLINQDAIWLGVGHAKGFDHIFDRWGAIHIQLKGSMSLCGREKDAQVVVKRERKKCHMSTD